MMSQIFLHIVNMSISAGYLVLAVLLLRLLLKKAPKWVAVVLWGIVALRLIFPFSIESMFSLIPSAQTVSPSIMTDPTPTLNTGIPILNSTINPIIEESFAPAPGDSANPLQIWVPILSAIWMFGMLALFIYTLISYVRVKRKIGTAIPLRDNIYQSENVVSPFVLGVIKPKIYLSFNMNEKDMAHVISHEQAHIRRKDHLWKPLGFLLLTLHWFNPLVWLGYILLCRDIELACDEKVIKELDHDARADYSEALLTCSVNRCMIAACPLAFGEVGVKERVKSVLHYKKPAFWIILTAILACIVLAICFLTSPIDKNNIGVKRISAKMVDSNIVELSIKCSFPSGSYSVRLVPEDEGEYIGDGMIDYDGSLGKYRVMITFGDTDKSKDFVKQLSQNNNVLEFKNNLIKVKTVAPSDHGFVMYLGFESPVTVEPISSNFNKNTIRCTIKIPIRILSNHLIYGFVPPASDSDKVSYVSIEDFGCDIKDVSVNFKDVLFGDNGQITFAMQWQNNSSNNIDIGPDFEVYKYNGSTLEKLEHRGIWLLYRLMLAGKGMNVADGIDVALFETKNTVSYDLSYHYNISKPGKYRLEAHGAWVDFQILGDGFVQKTEEMSYEKLTVDFPNADEHVFLEPRYSETFFVKNDTEWGGFYYHRYFKKCAECGKVLESTDVYRCQINHSLCEGDCIG